MPENDEREGTTAGVLCMNELRWLDDAPFLGFRRDRLFQPATVGKAEVAPVPYDDMIQYLNSQQFSSRNETSREFSILRAGLGIAARVVMDEHDGG